MTIIQKITVIMGWLAALLVIPLTLLTVYEVFARYGLGAPTIWAYEMGTMLTGAYFSLGMAYTLKEKAHVRIDVFYNGFSKKSQNLITALGYIFLFLPVSIWLTYALWGYMVEGYVSGEMSGQSAWNPVVWPFRFVVALGFTTLTLQAMIELFRCVRALRQRGS